MVSASLQHAMKLHVGGLRSNLLAYAITRSFGRMAVSCARLRYTLT